MSKRDELIDAIASVNFESIKKIQESQKSAYKQRAIWCKYENGKWVVYPWDTHNFKKTGTVMTVSKSSEEFASFLDKYCDRQYTLYLYSILPG